MSAAKKNAAGFLALTPAVEEGPYYKTGSPERIHIAAKRTPGRKMVVEGLVLDRHGRAVPGAWLDFWQADGDGLYDNDGFELRGHQYADKNGRYHLETVRPKQYMFRAPHVHVKVRANNKSPVLTSQLFFPDEERNATDPIFEKLTVMDVAEAGVGLKAMFDFVVETE